MLCLISALGTLAELLLGRALTCLAWQRAVQAAPIKAFP